MAELPVLPIAECVHISIFHQHNCEAKIIETFYLFLKINGGNLDL